MTEDGPTQMIITPTRQWFATAAYAALLAAGSLLPSGSGPLRGWDTAITPSVQNALHVPMYGVLVMLVLAALARWTPVSVGAAAAVCCTYGGLLECAQAAIPGRTASVSDAVLNAAGVGVGLLAAMGLGRLLRGKAGRAKPQIDCPCGVRRDDPGEDHPVLRE